MQLKNNCRAENNQFQYFSRKVNIYTFENFFKEINYLKYIIFTLNPYFYVPGANQQWLHAYADQWEIALILTRMH